MNLEPGQKHDIIHNPEMRKIDLREWAPPEGHRPLSLFSKEFFDNTLAMMDIDKADVFIIDHESISMKAVALLESWLQDCGNGLRYVMGPDQRVVYTMTKHSTGVEVHSKDHNEFFIYPSLLYT